MSRLTLKNRVLRTQRFMSTAVQPQDPKPWDRRAPSSGAGADESRKLRVHGAQLVTMALEVSLEQTIGFAVQGL